MRCRLAAGIALILTMAAGVAARGQMVIAKEGTRFYHWPGCPVVKDGQGVLAMNRGQAESRNLKPHPDCDPSKAQPSPDAAGPGGQRATATQVFVDETGKHYHRDRCVKLQNPSKKVVLDRATATKYWPCPTCRPPIRTKKG